MNDALMKFFVSGFDSCITGTFGYTRTNNRNDKQVHSLCGEHGTCVNQVGTGYRCSCQPGYTGKYCHESMF